MREEDLGTSPPLFPVKRTCTCARSPSSFTARTRAFASGRFSWRYAIAALRTCISSTEMYGPHAHAGAGRTSSAPGAAMVRAKAKARPMRWFGLMGIS
jgi:hypothetical protein